MQYSIVDRGSSEWVNTMYLFFVVLALLSLQASGSGVCKRKDCNLYDVPSAKDRVCWMNHRFGDVELEWHTGTLDEQTCLQFASRDILKFCPGYVGMNMSLWCDFAHITSVIYKDGIPLTGESTVTFDRLQKEDEGLYQCRQYDSGEVIGEFNMTVQGEIHIGGGNQFACSYFYCDTFKDHKCCFYGVWRPSKRQIYPFVLNIYGDSPISTTLSVEWITNRSKHYPTDLGLHLEQDTEDPTLWYLYFENYPQSVTGDKLEVIIQISASNNFSTFSTCLRVEFLPYNILSAETSLPQDVYITEGGNAIFSCEFGTSRPSSGNQPALSFEFLYNTSESITTMCLNWDGCDDWTPPNLPLPTNLFLQPVALFDRNNFKLYRYEVHLTSVVAELNGSVFSCSIISPYNTNLSQELIQWEGSADLIIVHETEDNKETLTTPHQGGSMNLASVLAPVSIILVLIVIFSSLLIAMVAWRCRKYQHRPLENNWIPIAAQEDIML